MWSFLLNYHSLIQCWADCWDHHIFKFCFLNFVSRQDNKNFSCYALLLYCGLLNIIWYILHTLSTHCTVFNVLFNGLQHGTSLNRLLLQTIYIPIQEIKFLYWEICVWDMGVYGCKVISNFQTVCTFLVLFLYESITALPFLFYKVIFAGCMT